MAIANAVAAQTKTGSAQAVNAVTLTAFTPPDNTLLVALAGFDWDTNFAGTPASPKITFSDSLSGSWAEVSESTSGSAGSSASGIGWTQIGTGSSMTVTATWNADSLTKTIFLVVAVLSGAATSGTIAGSLFSGGTATGTNTWAQKTVTTTTVGSLPLTIMVRDSTKTPTVNANTTEYLHFNDATVSSTTMCGRATNLTTTPGSLSLGWTLSGTGSVPACGDIVEIMPSTGTPAAPIRVVAVYQAINRAASF